MTKRTTRNKQPCSQRHWQAHVNALNNSGLSRAEYCRQQSLCYNALTYWHRKLSRPSTNTTTLVPVAIRPNIGQNIVQPDQAELKIILPGKMSVAVGDNFSPKTLTRLLATLESR